MLNKNKLLISGGLAAVLVATQVSYGTINTVSANSDIEQANNYNEEVYQTLQTMEDQGNGLYTFENGEQLIEKFDENGEKYYLTKDVNGEYDQKIYQDASGEVMYEDIQTGEVGVAVRIVSEEVPNLNKDMVTMSSDGYQYVSTIKNSTVLEVATASAIAGALSFFVPKPVAALLWLGQTYASFNAPSAYWYEVKSNKYEGNTAVRVKTQYIFHKYSDYNSYIGTEEDIQLYTGGPR